MANLQTTQFSSYHSKNSDENKVKLASLKERVLELNEDEIDTYITYPPTSGRKTKNLNV